MDITKALNPNAKPWEPTVEKGMVEDRTIFVTFSMGYPLNERQIRNFFNRYYGNCIEKVHVHQPNPARPPLYGKVIFNKRSIPLIILGDQEEKNFKINNRELRCKKYKRREERCPQQN